MKVTRKDESKNKVKLSILLDSSELTPVKDHVIESHFSDVKVPGFRVGQAPARLIEQNVDQQLVINEFLNHAVNEYYPRALAQENVRAIGQPEITIKKVVPYDTLEFEASQDILGPIRLANYKEINVSIPKIDVSTDQVNEVINNLRIRSASRKEVKGPAKKGDEVSIDFDGKDEKGEPVRGASGRDFFVVIGSNALIPGFEDNLVGLKAGSKKTFKLTFPMDYGVAELRSKQVSFSVSLKKVNKLGLPKLDDSFAKKTGQFKTLSELKKDIKKQLTAERETQAKRELENSIVKQIVDKSTLDEPQSLVEEQLMAMEAEEKRNLTFQGQTWQEHLKAENITEQQHRDRYKAEATERVKAGLVLSEIAIKEKIKVTPEEVDTRINELKSQYQDEKMQGELDDPKNRQDIAARLLTEKTIKKLQSYATQN